METGPRLRWSAIVRGSLSLGPRTAILGRALLAKQVAAERTLRQQTSARRRKLTKCRAAAVRYNPKLRLQSHLLPINLLVTPSRGQQSDRKYRRPRQPIQSRYRHIPLWLSARRSLHGTCSLRMHLIMARPSSSSLIRHRRGSSPTAFPRLLLVLSARRAHLMMLPYHAHHTLRRSRRLNLLSSTCCGLRTRITMVHQNRIRRRPASRGCGSCSTVGIHRLQNPYRDSDMHRRP